MAKLKFSRRPSPVFPEHRPLYKISQAICILGYTGRAGKASVAKINLMNWALNSKAREDALVEACTTKTLPFAAWGFDPALAIALHLCEAEGLISRTNNGHELTEKGNLFFSEISKDDELLTSEKVFLKRIGKKLTEEIVEKETKGWGANED